MEVYQHILASSRVGVDTFSHRDLIARLSRSSDSIDIGYVKLKIIIKVFQELNILGIDEFKDENYRFTVRYSQKTNLEKSNFKRYLRKKYGNA